MVGLGGPEAERGALGEMPSASLSVYLSRAISRCTKLALPRQGDFVLRLCFRVGLGARVEQSGRDGREPAAGGGPWERTPSKPHFHGG